MGGATEQEGGLIELELREDIETGHPFWRHAPRDAGRRWKPDGVGWGREYTKQKGTKRKLVGEGEEKLEDTERKKSSRGAGRPGTGGIIGSAQRREGGGREAFGFCS